MDSKLTLKLNESIILQAKKYAKENNISLSRMIENYLAAITGVKSKQKDISPLVESLTGVVKLEEIEYGKYYGDFLSKKYS